MIKEWLNEPNDKEFESSGYKCYIHRHPIMLHLCGYVALPLGNKFYGVDYGQLYALGIDIRVHGGLTAAYQEDDDWLFGFDCAHLYDLVPSSVDNGWQKYGDQYRNIEYVENELHNLARQLLELDTP
jgi:hypothetical protein